MSTEVNREMNTKSIVPIFPGAQRITKKTAEAVVGLLDFWIKNEWYNFIYYEEKINKLLNMDWLEWVKIDRIHNKPDIVIIWIEAKAKKEFIKNIKKNILATKITWNKNKVTFSRWWKWYRKVHICLYWSNIQIYLKIHEQD